MKSTAFVDRDSMGHADVEQGRRLRGTPLDELDRAEKGITL